MTYFGKPYICTAAGALAVLAVIVGDLADGSVQAQTAKGESATGRGRPEFAPIGIEHESLGTVRIFPSVTVENGYETNVFRQETDERADLFVRIAPKLDIRTDWDNHGLRILATGDVTRFVELESEDAEDFKVTATGDLDITERLTTRLDLHHARDHVARSSPDDVGGAKPTITFDTGAAVRLGFDGEVFDVDGRGSYRRVNVRDNDGINNDDQDKDEYKGTVRLSYESVPGSKFFVQPSITVEDFLDQLDDTGVNRDALTWNLLAGISVDYSAVTFFELGAGFRRRSFDDPGLASDGGVSVDGRAIWNATDLSTLTLAINNAIEDTTTGSASSRDVWTVSLRADHELLYSLLLEAGATYVSDNFNGIERSDQQLTLFAGADYRMNEYIRVRGRYTMDDKSSDERTAEFLNHALNIRVTGQL